MIHRASGTLAVAAGRQVGSGAPVGVTGHAGVGGGAAEPLVVRCRGVSEALRGSKLRRYVLVAQAILVWFDAHRAVCDGRSSGYCRC
jgi:hypothetical protein